MNLYQLKQSVIELGFDSELESNNAFLLSANRALLEVNDIAPKRAVFEYTNEHLNNTIGNGDMFKTFAKEFNSQQIFYGSSAVAYYFECNGTGTAYIERLGTDSIWESVKEISLIALDRKFKAYSGTITSSALINYRIRFTGVYKYLIRYIALYNELAEENIVPAYLPYSVIDLSLQTNFLGLTTDIYNADGDVYIKDVDYLVENNKKILIPYYKEGVFKIWYEIRPTEIPSATDISNDADIALITLDLEEDLAALLPELISHYIWLDGENLTKAQRYYDLYKVRAANILARRNKANTAFSYKTKGWA